MSCRFASAFGEPGKGVHQLRVVGLAAVDLLATAAAAVLVARLIKKPGMNLWAASLVVFIILMVLAVVVHEAFCVRTRLNAKLFGRSWPEDKNNRTLMSD